MEKRCETCGHYTEDCHCKLGSRTCFPDRDWIPKDAPDNVNHPAHYEQFCSLECIQVMELVFGANAVRGFCLCNAFKYMWRYKNKNGLEDLKKAQWYLTYASEYVSLGDDKHDFMGELLDQLMEKMEAERRTEPQEGQWVNGCCNKCGGHAPFWAMASTYYKSNFCPHCGARMQKVSEIDLQQ